MNVLERWVNSGQEARQGAGVGTDRTGVGVGERFPEGVV